MVSVGLNVKWRIEVSMPTCPHCGATVPEGAVYCGNCGASLSPASTSVSATQPQVTSQGSSAWQTAMSSDAELQARLEKALKRSEQLAYAVAGIGVAIIVLYLVLYLILPFA